MKGVMVKGAARGAQFARRPFALRTMRKKAPCRLLWRWWKGAALFVPRRRHQSRRRPMHIVRRPQGRRCGESEVLRVLTPGAVEAAVDTAQRVAQHTDEVTRALTLELDEARYQAARAERQYDAVEPENRLVADTLERRWNEALSRVGELDRRLAELKSEQSRQPIPDRARLLALSASFPAFGPIRLLTIAPRSAWSVCSSRRSWLGSSPIRISNS